MPRMEAKRNLKKLKKLAKKEVQKVILQRRSWKNNQPRKVLNILSE